MKIIIEDEKLKAARLLQRKAEIRINNVNTLLHSAEESITWFRVMNILI
jgi:hypothetical protein